MNLIQKNSLKLRICHYFPTLLSFSSELTENSFVELETSLYTPLDIPFTSDLLRESLQTTPLLIQNIHGIFINKKNFDQDCFGK
jgi:hypothetical protein